MKRVTTPEAKQSRQTCHLHSGNTESSFYNETSVNRLFKMISHSRQPIVPVELSHEINPLTQRLVDNPKGFSDLIDGLYGSFVADLHDYLERCQSNNIPKENYARVLAGLLKRFNKEQDRFNQSDMVMPYKEYVESFSLPVIKKNDSTSNADYSQKAIKYNYEAGLIQIGCINRGIGEIESLLDELHVSSEDLQKIPESKDVKEGSNLIDKCLDIKQPEFVGNPDYKFTVLKTGDFNINITLDSLYKALKNKYVNCSYSQFSKVFLDDKPKPVVWLKSYSSLSYMIKLMKGKFIETEGNISIYKVATKFFHQGEIGQYFHPPRYKCEVKDLSKKDQSDLDNIFYNLVTKINGSNFHSKNFKTDLREFDAKSCKKNLNELKGYNPILPANSTRLAHPPSL